MFPFVRVCAVTAWLSLATGTLSCTAGARAEQYNKRGELDLERGDADKALEAFDRAIELREGYAAAHRNRGRALNLKQDVQGAEKALRRAMELDPREALAMMELGRGLIFDKSRRDEGLDLCQRALKLDPSLALAWGCTCAAQGMRGETNQAILSCQKAIELDPDRTPAIVYGVYGRSLEAAGRLEDAGRAYEDALRQGEETPELLYRLAGVQARTGKQEEAVKKLHRAIELKPTYVQAHRTLAEYYIIQKNIELARHYVSSATSLGAVIPKPLRDEYEQLLASAPPEQGEP